MPLPIVTIRELKNQITGVDISVPNYKETVGLLSNDILFHVVVVSKQRCFKLPNHKESEVVQFMIDKKYEDFETLCKILQSIFPTVALPKLPRRYFGLNELSSREMQTVVDNLMKIVASNEDMATSDHVLRFLDVDPTKAFTLQKNVTHDDVTIESNKEQERVQLFSIVENEKDDAQNSNDWLVFNPKSKRTVVGGNDLFSEDSSSVQKIEDDSYIQSFHSSRVFCTNDGSDDDDIDKILRSSAGLKSKRPPVAAGNTSSDHKEIEDGGAKAKKEEKDEERIGNRINTSDTLPADGLSSLSIRANTSTYAPLMSLNKPVIKPKPSTSINSAKSGAVSAETQLAMDDIMAYITNNQTNDNDVDLFS